MAIQLKINAQPRTESGRNAVKKIKRAGFVPAVIYGAKDPSQNIQVVERELAKLLGRASSESVLVDVEIQDGAATRNRTALIQEVQHHPVTRAVLHLDLHAVAMDELLTAEVSVETLGEAIGVRQGGGVLELILRTLEIECLPADLPESIKVDVSALEVGDSIHVKTLTLPNGVQVLNDAELTVVSVAAPTVVEEPAGAIAEAGAQPEVVGEKKPETAGGGAPAAAAS
jgi:large subunit ribosomal protein L25